MGIIIGIISKCVGGGFPKSTNTPAPLFSPELYHMGLSKQFPEEILGCSPEVQGWEFYLCCFHPSGSWTPASCDHCGQSCSQPSHAKQALSGLQVWGAASPLVGSVITCVRKLLSLHFRNLLDWLCTAVLAFQQKMEYPGGPELVNVRILLWRYDQPMLSHSEVAQSLFFRSRHVCKIFWVLLFLPKIPCMSTFVSGIIKLLLCKEMFWKDVEKYFQHTWLAFITKASVLYGWSRIFWSTNSRSEGQSLSVILSSHMISLISLLECLSWTTPYTSAQTLFFAKQKDSIRFCPYLLHSTFS